MSPVCTKLVRRSQPATTPSCYNEIMSGPLVSKQAFLAHFDYTLWASMILLDAAGRLSIDELTRDMKTSHTSILGTLQHIYYADRTWLARLRQAQQRFADPPPGPDLNALEEDWPKVIAGLRSWVEEEPEARLGEDLHSRRLNGDAFACAHWKVLLHVVNHATMHRGQVMTMYRQLGHVPPCTDLFLYHLQHP